MHKRDSASTQAKMTTYTCSRTQYGIDDYLTAEQLYFKGIKKKKNKELQASGVPQKKVRTLSHSKGNI